MKRASSSRQGARDQAFAQSDRLRTAAPRLANRKPGTFAGWRGTTPKERREGAPIDDAERRFDRLDAGESA
jgi:hypothetical protein